MTDALFTAFMMVAASCPSGAPMNVDGTCPNGEAPQQVEIQLLNGIGNWSDDSADMASRTQSIAVVKIDGKVVGEIPTTAITKKNLQTIWEQFINVGKAMNLSAKLSKEAIDTILSHYR